MSKKDVNNLVQEGATLLDMLSMSAPAHQVRAQDEIAKFSESEDKQEYIKQSSIAVAIANALKRDPDWTRSLLLSLSESVAESDIHLLATAVDEVVSKKLKVHKNEAARTAKSILEGVGNEDYEIPSGILIPTPWDLRASGLCKIEVKKNGPETVLVSQSPILPVGLLKDTITGKEFVVIAWCTGPKWSHVIIPRGDATTKRKLEAWSDYGLPVSSSNSTDLANYMSAMVVENYTTFPRARISTAMGWHDDNSTFLAGRTMITRDSLIKYDFDINEVSPVAWEKEAIYFMSADAGNSQLADALTQSGSMKEWKEAIEFFDDKPRARAAIVFALCGPLLHIIDNSSPFSIDWGGGTSRGKSTTLTFAASVWGLGQEEGNRYFATWESTRTNIERTLGTLRHIPFVIDDTKKARRKEDVTKVIYDVTSGIGRGRASINGLQVSGHYKTVMMTSGESKVTSFSRDGGSFTRVLQFYGSPMDKHLTSDELTELRRSMVKLTRNYGLAGPLFVQKLLANKGSWDKLQKKYNEYLDFWSSSDCIDRPQSQYGGRLAKYAAIFQLASVLANAMLGIKGFTHEELMRFWTEWNEHAEDADQARMALTFICNTVMLDRSAFWSERGANDHRVPIGGWHGIVTSTPGDTGIYFERSWLERTLYKSGYDVSNVIGSWMERGWLISKKGRLEHRKTVNGYAVMLLHLSGPAVQEGLGLGEKSDI